MYINFPKHLINLPIIEQPNGIYVGHTGYVEQRLSEKISPLTQGKFLLPDKRWVWITDGKLIFQRYIDNGLLMYGQLNYSGSFADEYH